MAVPTVVGVGASTSGQNALSVPLPGGGAVAADIVLLFVETQNQAVPAVTGYADVLNSPQSVGTGTNPTRLTVRWHRATGTETANISVGDSGDHQIARTIILRGVVATGNPWNVTSGSTELVSDTSVSGDGLTTTVADCLIVAAVATGQDVNSTAHVTGWANAGLTGVAEQMNNWTSSGGGGGFGVATGSRAATGAVPATTATVAAANFKALFTMAVPGVAGANATATPAVVAATAAVPRPAGTVRAGPVALPATAGIPQAAVAVGTAATRTPAVIVTAATLPQTTAAVIVGPPVLAATATLPQATATGGGPAPVSALSSTIRMG